MASNTVYGLVRAFGSTDAPGALYYVTRERDAPEAVAVAIAAFGTRNSAEAFLDTLLRADAE